MHAMQHQKRQKQIWKIPMQIKKINYQWKKKIEIHILRFRTHKVLLKCAQDLSITATESSIDAQNSSLSVNCFSFIGIL